MKSAETSAEIDQAAADWVAREQGRGLSASDSEALEAWLAGDDRRRGAYVRAHAGWVLLDRARALKEPSHLVSRREASHTISRRGLAVGAGCAAVAAAGGAVFFIPPSAKAQRVETAFGETRKVALEDGSAAFLNTATTVDFRYRRDLRLIDLHQGEAWFEVAKEPRPFQVMAGKVGVRAVGTAFSVHRTPAETVVLVSEGVVQLSDGRGSAGGPRLKAGMRATIDPNGVIDLAVLTPHTVDRSLAWREGWIALDGETVEEAAAIFNRYNTVKLVVADRSLGAEPVIGRFSDKDPQSFARSVEVGLGAQIDIGDGRIVLKRP